MYLMQVCVPTDLYMWSLQPHTPSILCLYGMSQHSLQLMLAILCATCMCDGADGGRQHGEEMMCARATTIPAYRCILVIQRSLLARIQHEIARIDDTHMEGNMLWCVDELHIVDTARVLLLLLLLYVTPCCQCTCPCIDTRCDGVSKSVMHVCDE